MVEPMTNIALLYRLIVGTVSTGSVCLRSYVSNSINFPTTYGPRKKYIKSSFVSKCNANLLSPLSDVLEKRQKRTSGYRTGYILEQFVTIV